MTPADAEQISRFARAVSEPIPIGLRCSPDSPGPALEKFCAALSAMVPNVVVAARPAQGSDGPAIEVTDRLVYRALPAGVELGPFLSGLAAAAGHGQAPPVTIRERLGEIRAPADVKIYITPDCPFCPRTVGDILPWIFVCGALRLTVIDGTLFPASARADAVRSAPTVLIDDRFRWSGNVDVQEILTVLSGRKPSAIGAASLQALLADGQAGYVAQMMIDSASILPAFIELLVHDKWPVRLGAMVAFESIAAADTNLAARVIAPLWQRFDDLSDPIKGDVLHVFGETGHRDAADKIVAVIDGAYGAEVKAAAAESLVKLPGQR